jgi:SAM-dependent methyltransferase
MARAGASGVVVAVERTWNDEVRLHRIPTLRDRIGLSGKRVLEIGPLDKPIVLRLEADVTYVDHADTEALRAKYRDDPAVNVRRIVPIDAVWGARSLADCVAGRFDFVFASHVLEHVPDLITWLNEVTEVLADDGELRVVLPDCRFGFDVLRRETTLADLLTNYLLRARRPQLHNVLDFRLNFTASMDGWRRYAGTLDMATVKRAYPFGVALASARAAIDAPNDYFFDVHCWVFQPRSFAGLMAELCDHRLVTLRCVKMIDTAMPLLEFYAFIGRGADPLEAAASWREAAARMQDPLPGSAEARHSKP